MSPSTSPSSSSSSEVSNPPSPYLRVDDLVRLPNGSLGFIECLPGYDTDSDSDSSSDDSSDTDSVADLRGRLVPIATHLEFGSQTSHTRRETSSTGLISTYDDATGSAADTHEAEPRTIGTQRRPPVPIGFALVSSAFSSEQSVIPVSDLTPIDRQFDPGTTVLPTNDVASCQSALVERVRKLLTVRYVDDITAQTAMNPDPATCFVISADALGFFSGIRAGDSVVRRSWAGVIEHFEEEVYVSFSDGAIACVPGHQKVLQNADPRTPDQSRSDPFIEGLYYPGQKVRALPEVWQSMSTWIRGCYSGLNEGVVKSISVDNIGVRWVAKSMYSGPDDDNPLPPTCSDRADGQDVHFPVSLSALTFLEEFRHMWWTVGDHGYLHSDPVKSIQVSDVTNEHDVDGEWKEDVAKESNETVHVSEEQTRNSQRSRSRRHSSRFFKAQRRARERNTQPEVAATAKISVTNPSVDPCDVVQVVDSRTSIDVLWQDGTREQNVSTLRFRHHFRPDPFEFYPGELVHLAAGPEDDPSMPDSISSGHKHGVLMRMNQHERTAVVRWVDKETEDYLEDEPEEELSVYDLQSNDFEGGIGDAVLRVPTSLEPEENRPDWIGAIIGQRDGKHIVQWVDGSVSDEPHSKLLLLVHDDDDDESYEDDSSSEDDSRVGEFILSVSDGRTVVSTGHLRDPVHRQLIHNWGAEPGDDDYDATNPQVRMRSFGRAALNELGYNPAVQNVLAEIDDEALTKALDKVQAWVADFVNERELGPQLKGGWELSNLASLFAFRLYSELCCENLATLTKDNDVRVPVRSPVNIPSWEQKCKHVINMLCERYQSILSTVGAPGFGVEFDSEDKSYEETNGKIGDVTKGFSCMEGWTDAPQTEDDAAENEVERFDVVGSLDGFHKFKDDSAIAESGGVSGIGTIVNREWRRLKSSLPKGIYVRASEKRQDQLRAVIVGPEGTPYADILFIFDIYLTCKYPLEPPQVWFHSFGRRLNPNLYEDGKVCLSILGTWDGDDIESWDPKNSNLLRVLLSLQALVFVEEPYFNEAGYLKQRDTEEGVRNSRTYNESAVLLSLKHCLSTIINDKVPKDCKDIVFRHYSDTGGGGCQRVLERCQRLLDHGDIDDGGEVREKAKEEFKREAYCSAGFRKSLNMIMERLDAAFKQLNEGKKKGEKKMGNTPSRVNREEAADAMIANYVEKNEVVVFSKRTCGYCQVKVVELDNDSSIEDDEMMYVRDALIRRTGLKTVPQVFINSKLVGGADDTAQMARVGGLRVALLHAAKCTPSH